MHINICDKCEKRLSTGDDTYRIGAYFGDGQVELCELCIIPYLELLQKEHILPYELSEKLESLKNS